MDTLKMRKIADLCLTIVMAAYLLRREITTKPAKPASLRVV